MVFPTCKAYSSCYSEREEVVSSSIVVYTGALIVRAFHNGRDTEPYSQREIIISPYRARAFGTCDLNDDVSRSRNVRKGEKKLRIR